ncbi:hypothetical protein SynRCC2555_00337 [Synechococcus sp. WH 8101]|nr:hypothetical protein SynRCC2555_00337 [Synechococcus sp. WH 8101]
MQSSCHERRAGLQNGLDAEVRLPLTKCSLMNHSQVAIVTESPIDGSAPA